VAKEGPYDPWQRLQELGKTDHLLTVRCDDEVEAQPPNVVRARHGLPPASNVKRWSLLRNKQRRWDDRREREEAKKRAEEEAAARQQERADEDDPEE
jgi:hypothetical protein